MRAALTTTRLILLTVTVIAISFLGVSVDHRCFSVLATLASVFILFLHHPRDKRKFV